MFTVFVLSTVEKDKMATDKERKIVTDKKCTYVYRTCRITIMCI